MVRALITWSLHNRFIVLLGTLGLIVVGIYSAINLNVEAYPDPTPPLVEVITQNPGASPEEMERLIGIPLETALNGMPGLKYLRSTSLAGLNDIKCQFEYGTDYWAARQEVINRIGMVNNLPPGVTPGLSPWSPTGEIVRYVLEGPGYTLNQLKAVQDWVLARAFKTVPGVIDVTGYGGTVKQYQVLLDTQLMRQYDVTLQLVKDAISQVQRQRRRRHPLAGLAVAQRPGHRPDRRGDRPARPGQGRQRLRDRGREARGHPRRRRHLLQRHAGLHPPARPGGRRPPAAAGDRRPQRRERRRRGHRPDAEVREVAADVEKVQEKIDELNNGSILPKGMKIVPFNQRTDLVHVTTHNVRPQPGRGHGAGDR